MCRLVERLAESIVLVGGGENRDIMLGNIEGEFMSFGVIREGENCETTTSDCLSRSHMCDDWGGRHCLVGDFILILFPSVVRIIGEPAPINIFFKFHLTIRIRWMARLSEQDDPKRQFRALRCLKKSPC